MEGRGQRTIFESFKKRKSLSAITSRDHPYYPKITGAKRAIVDFNNQFFGWVGSDEDPEQKQMFEQQTQQEFNLKKGAW